MKIKVTDDNGSSVTLNISPRDTVIEETNLVQPMDNEAVMSIVEKFQMALFGIFKKEEK
jgi:hypothetical protein